MALLFTNPVAFTTPAMAAEESYALSITNNPGTTFVLSHASTSNVCDLRNEIDSDGTGELKFDQFSTSCISFLAFRQKQNMTAWFSPYSHIIRIYSVDLVAWQATNEHLHSGDRTSLFSRHHRAMSAISAMGIS